MASTREQFWSFSRFVVIGDSRTAKPFARFTYQGLKKQGKTAYAVDRRARDRGDTTYPDSGGAAGAAEAA